MGYGYISLVKLTSLSIILLSTYTALSISRLPPSPTVLVSSILVAVGYILLSFNIIWTMKIEWKHLVVFIALSGIGSLAGLVDVISLYMTLTIVLLLAISKTHTVSSRHTAGRILSSKYVIAMILAYYIIASTVILIQYMPILPETLGLAEVRGVLSMILVSKIFYAFISLFIVALIYSLYKDTILLVGGVELRRKILRELVELVENVVYGRDVYYMFIVEIMLLIAGALIYPVILFFLIQLRLIVSGLIYIIGIILTYISWIILRMLTYRIFSTSNISVDEAKRILTYIWMTITILIIVFSINPSTTNIVASLIGYPGEPSRIISLFNKFYTSIIGLEFNAVKLLVELLWG